jgi:hypothetical protein
MAQFESIKFQPQRPLLRELSADRLNTVLQEIRRNKPKGERGITVRQSGDGTYIGLAAAITSGTASGESSHPFQILTRTSSNGNSIFIGVRPKSYVFSAVNVRIEPSGILTDASDDSDAGWQNASGKKYVWLEFVNDEEQPELSVKFGDESEFDPEAGFWTNTSFLETDGNQEFPVFKKARRIIAEIVEEDDSIRVIQCMKGHQTLTDVVVNGIPAGYFFEWGAGLLPE